MDLMVSVYDTHLAPLIEKMSGTGTEKAEGPLKLQRTKFLYGVQVEEVMALVRDQQEKLAKEVERWCLERGV
jgi:indoleamine 2,3-dioxygenase